MAYSSAQPASGIARVSPQSRLGLRSFAAWLLTATVAGCALVAAGAAGEARAAAAETGSGGNQAEGRVLAANAASWSDPEGDADPLAPDITSVSVFNTDDGVLVIRVALPDSEHLVFGESVSVWFDVDQNTRTGSGGGEGAEFLVSVGGFTGVSMQAWEDDAWLDVYSSVSASWRFGPTITLDLYELGSPGTFNFWVGAGWQGDSGEHFDFAPGGDGWWSYQVLPPVPDPVDPPDQGEDEEDGELLLRPPTGGEFGYEQPESTFEGERVVVHYVTEGPDAPPLNDDDGSGLPDYVEEIAAAADWSLFVFELLGFEAPLADTAGPDERPDIYVKRLDARILGLAVFPGYGEGGSFVIVDTRLDPASVELSRFSLQTTVAHELFHLVQYAYLPDGGMPRWIAEGTASAVELVTFPDIDDIGLIGQIDSWISEPWRELHDESNGCERCYGGAIWWHNLHSRDPGLLPAYFDRLARLSKRGQDFGIGAAALSTLIGQRQTFGQGFGSLYEAFVKLSTGIYRAGHGPGAYRTLTPKRTPRTTRVLRVKGLSTHYIPVKVRRGTKRLQIRISTTDGPVPDVRLIIGGTDGRTAKPRIRQNGRAIVFTPRLRNKRDRGSVMLIITSGHRNAATYKITHYTR